MTEHLGKKDGQNCVWKGKLKTSFDRIRTEDRSTLN